MLPSSLGRPDVQAILREAETPALTRPRTTNPASTTSSTPTSSGLPAAAPSAPSSHQYGPPQQYTRRDGRPPWRSSFRPQMHGPRTWVPHSSAPPPFSQRDRNLGMVLRFIPGYTTVKDIYTSFERYGKIVFIELDGVNRSSSRKARLRFEPFPTDLSFFNQGQATIWTGCGNIRVWVEFSPPRGDDGKMKTPLGNLCPGYVKLPLRSLTFGVLEGPTSFIAKKCLEHVDGDMSLSFVIDFRRRKLMVHFAVSYSEASDDKQKSTTPPIPSYYKAEIKFSNLGKLFRVSRDGKLGLVITVRDPPIFSRKRSSVDGTFKADRLIWDDYELYQRAVDIRGGPTLATHPVSLDEDYQIIDIGRWTTYWLELDTTESQALSMVKLCLRDWNIKISDNPSFAFVPNQEPELWHVLKGSEYSQGLWSQYLGSMESQLPFDVRYQLEVCISRDILSEYNIGREFVAKLFELSEIKVMGLNRARLVLEYAADQGKRVFDPMSLFQNKSALEYLPATINLPSECTLMRKVTITPTRIIYSTPTVETTNRVLRQFKHLHDRFIRIQFTDEMLEGRLPGCDSGRNDLTYRRALRVLDAGLRMGNAHWKFLAYGNSQLREHAALLFNEVTGEETVTCDMIRQSMGQFNHITVVAKYAARQGQCLSTTRPVPSISAPRIVEIDDVEKFGYCFTDGVGKISPFLAKMVAEDWKVFPHPSAIQFRMGGCKGVLVTWPSVKGVEVHVRKSQDKFSAEFNGLEVIRCSQYASATLNRQTITILSSLGVPDKSFIDILLEQVANYDAAMQNPTKAADLLRQYVDENQITLVIRDMVLNGFMKSTEPFVHTLMHLWRSWSIKALKEKARLIVEQSAFVLGCVDETDTLRGHKKSTEGREKVEICDLPQIFIQIPDPNSETKFRVITGVCIVGRNPSLHPGDIRVVEAVDAPALRHLKNVVVFPLGGDRDVPGMCSGGDLDGDDFFVIWDKRLIPTEWGHPPMDYTPAKAREEKGEVREADLKAFFVLYMKNNTLPLIAHAHLATADLEPGGPKNKKCLELAQKHSMAVDYVKTGNPVLWDKTMDPSRWPHFMEKRSNSIHSKSALGQIYDRVRKVEVFDVEDGYKLPFDQRIKKRFTLSNDLLKTARRIKCQYDIAMRRVMAQLEIGTEFEIWTAFVMSKPRVGSAYKIQEKVGHESHALKKQFRDMCIKEAGSRDSEVLGPFVAAMYQVTWEEVGIALHESRQPHILSNGRIGLRRISARSMPLISFPWMFAEVLGELAGGSAARRGVNSRFVHHMSQETPTEVEGPEVDESIGEEDIGQSYTRTSDGQVIHRGEILNLFHQDEESEEEEHEDDSEQQTPSLSDKVTGLVGSKDQSIPKPAPSNTDSSDLPTPASTEETDTELVDTPRSVFSGTSSSLEELSLLDLDKAAGEELIVMGSTSAANGPKAVETMTHGTTQADSLHPDVDKSQDESKLSDTADETNSCTTSPPTGSVTDDTTGSFSVDTDSELEFEQDVIELPAESALERAARLFA